jgi:hypothetical protein
VNYKRTFEVELAPHIYFPKPVLFSSQEKPARALGF